MACPYCREKDRENLIDYDGFLMWLDNQVEGEFLYIEVPVEVGTRRVSVYVERRANYCPECGRKLGDA